MGVRKRNAAALYGDRWFVERKKEGYIPFSVGVANWDWVIAPLT